MKIVNEEIIKKTNGKCDIIDLTDDATDFIKRSKIKNGLCTIFSVGSTGGITTVEYEPGLLKDIPKFFEKIIPSAVRYHHDDTWGDGNGHAHIRSSLLKTSLLQTSRICHRLEFYHGRAGQPKRRASATTLRGDRVRWSAYGNARGAVLR